MKTITKYAIAILLGLVALASLGGVALAFAAPAVMNNLGWGQHQPPFGGRGGMLVGKVATVSTDGFTVTTQDSKTVTVTVTSQTKIFVLPGQSTGTLSDIKVGDTVRVMGRAGSSGAVEAQTIMVGPEGDVAAGQVTAVNGATITVQSGRGMTVTTTIVTDANTKFLLAGNQSGTLADVKVGVFVQAYGKKQADNSLLATQVVVGKLPGPGRGWDWGAQPPFGGRGGMLAGKVATVSTDGFTVTTADSKTVTVTVTSQTKIFVLPGQSTGALSDIKVGDTVRVMGRAGASGAVEAQTVSVGPEGDVAGGQVTAVNGTTITVQSGRGMTVTTTIVTDANTKFLLAGNKAGTLADVKVGVVVKAYGQKQADNSLLATQVFVGNQPGAWPGMPVPGWPGPMGPGGRGMGHGGRPGWGPSWPIQPGPEGTPKPKHT